MDRLEFWSRIAVIALALCGLFAALDVAQNLVAPALLGLVVGIVMSPIPNALDRVGLPKSLAALSSLLIIMLIVTALALFLQPSFKRLSEALPFAVTEINSFVVEFRNQFRDLEDAGKDVAKALGEGEGDTSQGGGTSDEGEGDSVAENLPTVEDALFLAPTLMSQIMIFVGVLFFFMLTRDEIYRWIADRLAPEGQGGEVAERLLAAEKQVGRYFLTISIINAGYAVVVTATMMAIGLPSPVLWGIGAGLLNFVLYLGPALMVAGLLLAGLVSFSGPYALLPAGTYLLINIIESQFVSPSVVGRAMRVNPLLIFLSLVFFLWLWGAIGGVIAIPLLLWIVAVSADIRDVRRSQVSKIASELPEA